MNDLFNCTCPHCGQPMPDQAETSFDAFWSDVPHKIAKSAAQKRWARMSSADRKAAHDGVRGFYAWFKREYPTASPIHPATYLSNRRWEDERGGDKVPATDADKLKAAAKAIATGKRFLCTHIPSSRARDAIAARLVTEDQCRAVGVL
jgi:hypothetical protein